MQEPRERAGRRGARGSVCAPWPFFFEQKVVLHRPESLNPKGSPAILAQRQAICIVEFYVLLTRRTPFGCGYRDRQRVRPPLNLAALYVHSGQDMKRHVGTLCNFTFAISNSVAFKTPFFDRSRCC